MQSHLRSECSVGEDGCGREAEPNGWHHRLRQSWLKTTDTCLERARLEHEKTLPRWETDAASVGTAMHTAIEVNLDSPLSLSDTLELWDDEFSTLMALENFRWIKYTEASARRFGHKCINQIYPELPNLGGHTGLEVGFVVTLIDDTERTIELSGTMDALYPWVVRDWKTSGGADRYERWQYQRWSTQATVYTYAAMVMGWLDVARVNADGMNEYDFEFVVAGMKELHTLKVTRTSLDFEFLTAKCEHLAKLIEVDLAVWPLNDNHALCSQKWCPAWTECKGKGGLYF